jgi:hypothetical protein
MEKYYGINFQLFTILVFMGGLGIVHILSWMWECCWRSNTKYDGIALQCFFHLRWRYQHKCWFNLAPHSWHGYFSITFFFVVGHFVFCFSMWLKLIFHCIFLGEKIKLVFFCISHCVWPKKRPCSCSKV